jgi:REP element-mobilizing transposase RayT
VAGELQSDVLAYFITFTTYATWLPGDQREWVDRAHNWFEADRLPADERRQAVARTRQEASEFRLDEACRAAVRSAIEDTAATLGWILVATNVRTNHVHLVVWASELPEIVMRKCKAWSTRRLHDLSLIAADQKVWTRHGSTRWLWKQEDVDAAAIYVLEGQGTDPDWR